MIAACNESGCSRMMHTNQSICNSGKARNQDGDAKASEHT
jgi:hypothetical protein